MKTITVPISPGELLDKLTILRLKMENILDQSKIVNVERELTALQHVADAALPQSEALDALVAELQVHNADLWEIEDNIRLLEADGDFGAGFIALARAVYITNDQRAATKKKINQLLGSDLVEEKSYKGEDAA